MFKGASPISIKVDLFMYCEFSPGLAQKGRSHNTCATVGDQRSANLVMSACHRTLCTKALLIRFRMILRGTILVVLLTSGKTGEVDTVKMLIIVSLVNI